jgi:hypothetical protein
MSLEYEIDNILRSLDNIDDAFHVEENYDGEGYEEERANFEEADEVRKITSEITEKCYDLITFLKTRVKYENTL